MIENPLILGLRHSGAKLTPQRLAICEWLSGSEEHPSVQHVYDALRESVPTLSLATVYNTIALLEELDLVHPIATGEDGSVRYEPSHEPHVNLVCRRCNRIVDMKDVSLNSVENAVKANGFSTEGLNVVVHSLCTDCHEAILSKEEDRR